MLNATLAEVMEHLEKADTDTLKDFNISVFRNITVETIEPYLQYCALQVGLNARVSFGGYDTAYRDSVVGCPELLNKDTDCVLVFEYLDNLSLKLSREFASLSKEEIEVEVDRIQSVVENILYGIRNQTDAMILWHGFEQPLFSSLGIFDCQLENGQLGTVRALNAYLRRLLTDTPNAYFVDMNLLLGRIGEKQFYDRRYWHIGRAPYSREGSQAIAFEVFKYIRSMKGHSKKCLVLDCDNTLWGGILGEEGLSGIALSKTSIGEPFYELQQEILNLYRRGIILALCSKNNEEDVWNVFENHPDMVLRKKHIASAQINWDDKVLNLRRIAIDLRIGIDSLVFVDDSEFEVNLVKKELPEVEVIHLPRGKTVEYRKILASCGLFDSLTLTAEDFERGAMYSAEAVRKHLKLEYTDMTSYYRELEMVVDIRYATEFAIPRISQQTQKTNQFNLTTRRYNDSDIKCYLDEASSDVLTLELTDRFGASGIVGTCIVIYEKEKAFIDTLLLSCRVLGRNVEHVFLVHVLQLAKKKGCKQIFGEYLRSPKNSQVEFFYSNNGFDEICYDEIKQKRVFFYDLSKRLECACDYFKEIRSELA